MLLVKPTESCCRIFLLFFMTNSFSACYKKEILLSLFMLQNFHKAGYTDKGFTGRCFIIAEAGTSHCGDLKKAFTLIDAAAAAGCDCVKFQMVYADEIVHPLTGDIDLPGGKTRLYEVFKSLEQEPAFYRELKEYTEKQQLEFLCTPFGLQSAALLYSIGVNAIKIASPELNHIPLLKAVAAYSLPVLLSTGVSTLGDIEAAVNIVGRQSLLLHCITQYPAPENEYNLELIPLLSRIFGLPVGISDHSLHPVLVPVLAVSRGACVVEKHFTLSNADTGLDDPIALDPGKFAVMVQSIRKAEKMAAHDVQDWMSREYGNASVTAVLGTGIKTLAPSEKTNYGTTNRSILALGRIKAGEVFTHENIAILRSEKKLKPGLHPRYYDLITGKKALISLEAGEGVEWRHVL